MTLQKPFLVTFHSKHAWNALVAGLYTRVIQTCFFFAKFMAELVNETKAASQILNLWSVLSIPYAFWSERNTKSSGPLWLPKPDSWTISYCDVIGSNCDVTFTSDTQFNRIWSQMSTLFLSWAHAKEQIFREYRIADDAMLEESIAVRQREKPEVISKAACSIGLSIHHIQCGS